MLGVLPKAAVFKLSEDLWSSSVRRSVMDDTRLPKREVVQQN